MQQAGEVVVPYITENPFMSEEQISKVKAGDTISFDHDVRLKMETVKDADEKNGLEYLHLLKRCIRVLLEMCR